MYFLRFVFDDRRCRRRRRRRPPKRRHRLERAFLYFAVIGTDRCESSRAASYNAAKLKVFARQCICCMRR